MIASPAAIAALTFGAMLAGHMVADHWIQTDHQAAHKGERSCNKGQSSLRGHWNCFKHVASYTATCLVLVVAAAAALGHFDQISPTSLAIATAINFGTHYWADRRYTLAWLARVAAHANFYKLGAPRSRDEGYDDNPSLGTGAYALDQSFHYLFLFVASVVTATGSS